jgi:D-threo-aldose 1-dehydrogenase
MKSVLLPGTDIRVSRFVFGTASLHHVGTLNRQIDHLRAAADAGFTHFDTAPLYGFGGAETAIGEAFNARSDITVTTKVGLYPPGGCNLRSRRTMLVRKAMGRILPKFSRPVADWSVAQARTSLNASLRRLRRERVDVLLLHEPEIDLLATDEWLRWLEEERDRVGTFGIAGPAARVAPFVRCDHSLARIVQSRDGIESCEADFMIEAGRRMQFTYGYLSGLANGLDPVEILTGALSRNLTGAIVVSTCRRDRLPLFAGIA